MQTNSQATLKKKDCWIKPENDTKKQRNPVQWLNVLKITVTKNEMIWIDKTWRTLSYTWRNAVQGAAQVFLLVSAQRSSHFPVLCHIV